MATDCDMGRVGVKVLVGVARRIEGISEVGMSDLVLGLQILVV